MTKIELYNVLLDNDWTIKKGIDDCAYKQLPDRQIQVIPGIKRLLDEYQIIMMPSVSTKDFSVLVKYNSALWYRQNNQQSIYTKNLTREVVENYLQEIETWAQEQDIEAGLLKYSAIPFDTKGIYPLYHLSALAITGQTLETAEAHR